MADVQVTNNTGASRFEAAVEGETAFADYQLEGDAITFPHTVVPEALEGRGIGGALVKAGLSYAREKGLKVIPLCSFFAGYMARHPETHDLVHPDHRHRVS